MLRMIDNLFATRASFGRCSHRRTPDTDVPIDENSPRIPSGAFGLGSHVSSWLWPPLANRTITDLARPNPAGRSDVETVSPENTRLGAGVLEPRPIPDRAPNRNHSRRLSRDSEQPPEINLRKLIGVHVHEFWFIKFENRKVPTVLIAFGDPLRIVDHDQANTSVMTSPSLTVGRSGRP